MLKKWHFRKNVENQFWPVLKYVKNYAEFESAVHFAWNLQKWWVFDNFHFWYFCILLFFGVGGIVRNVKMFDVDKLRIQGRMQIFEKKSQSALNHVLIG